MIKRLVKVSIVLKKAKTLVKEKKKEKEKIFMTDVNIKFESFLDHLREDLK